LCFLSFYTNSRRQCKDYLYQAFEWGIFSSTFFGVAISHARYGKAMTTRRFFWNGLAAACFAAPGLTLFVWVTCPFCQPFNRDGLQAVSVEQRFKNYIDQKYHVYDNADEQFYKRLTY
jgi:hypothetical protein